MDRILERMLRLPEVAEVTGLSKTTIWRRVRSGDFPAPVRLGGRGSRSVGWRKSDIEDWLDSRTALPQVGGHRR